MQVLTPLLAFTAGLLVAVVTAPVGVSGAVFLLPVQLDLLRVPSPAVTPTNLLFNLVATPGALWRYRRSGTLDVGLVGQLLIGTVPGIVVGSCLRVLAAPGDRVFRLLAAAVLLPIGLWLCSRVPIRAHPAWTRGARLVGLGALVGVVGGLYGIGGGSLLGPLLVGAGLPVARVAPAALATTFVTSVAGVGAFVVLGIVTSVPTAPDWGIGIACGVGGLVGGYLGAALQPRMPDSFLRMLLGAVAVALAVLYLVQAVNR